MMLWLNTNPLKKFNVAASAVARRTIISSNSSLKTSGQAQTVRQHQEWLHSRFPGAKLQAEKWYPVRADAVCKPSVLEDTLSTTIKSDCAQQIGNENGVTIRKLQWLSKPDAEKTYGSMIVYLASREDAVK